MVNIRSKGQRGERDIMKLLNDQVIDIRKEAQLPPLDKIDLPFQRNQNQSAVGGSDLSNVIGLEIEVKVQEQLSIGSWWRQTVGSAGRTGGIPILAYKQSYKGWKFCMYGGISIGPNRSRFITKCQIDKECFVVWFRAYYREWLMNTELVPPVPIN